MKIGALVPTTAMQITTLISLVIVGPLLRTNVAQAFQQPVPAGEGAKGQIRGSVTDENGAVLPGVEVTAVNLKTGQTTSATTRTDGEFTFPALPPGKYRVSAALAGFAVTEQTVTTMGGQAGRLDLKLRVGPVPEGEMKPRPASTPTPRPTPVPEGEPQRSLAAPQPTPSSSALEVVDKSAPDEVDLQAWLNRQADLGLEAIAVVPIEPRRSLFVFAQHFGSQAPACLVLVVAGTPSSTDLQSRLLLYPQHRFLGLHRLPTSFLIVLSHER